MQQNWIVGEKRAPSISLAGRRSPLPLNTSCSRHLHTEAPERPKLMNRRAMKVAITLISLSLCSLWSTTAVAQTVKLSATTVTFGNVVVGLTSTHGLTVTNTGTSNLVISSVSATGSFQSNNCSNPTVPPNGTCTLSITFAPTTSGSSTGTLSINDNASNSPQTVSLSGTGVLGVSLNSTTLQFPTQGIGSTSPALTTTLLNNEPTALTITSVTATGPFAVTTCPASLPPAGSCVISVTFTPTVAGNVTGTLTVTDSASSSPQTATLRGVGSTTQLSSIAVTPANPSIAAGTTQPFTATGTYSNGTAANITTSVTWSSSLTSVATISAIGLANSVSAGASTITATYGSISGSTLLTVTPPALVSLAVTPSNPSVPAGATQQFTATGTYTNGTTANLSSSAIWTSSVMSTATINSVGLATSIAAGTSTITATSGTISGSTLLTVTAPTLVSIAVTPSNPSVSAGATQQFNATGTYTNGTTTNLTNTATWTSSATSAATINSAGLATTVAVGASTITATSGTISGSTLLTVTAPAPVSIAVTPSNPSVPAGNTQQFTATGTYANGTTANLTSSVTWTSSATGVATINAAGLATSVAAGASTITATSGTISGSTVLTVTAPTLVSIAVTPSNPLISTGATQQFTAIGTYSNGTTGNLNSSATWTSSVTSVATINSTGLATAVSAGTSTITATSGTISGSTVLTTGATTASVSPTALAFGTVAVSTTSTLGLTILNTGTSNLVISGITATGGFKWSNCANAKVAPGSTCTINVSFTPTTIGLSTGTLTITDNAVNSPQTVSLTGAGVASVSLSPSSLQYGNQVVGSTSPAQTITLINDQATSLNITSVTTSGPFAATTCPGSIPPSGTCVISVTFTPNAVYQLSGTLTVVNNASSSPQIATLRGIGIASQLTSITVTPANPSIASGATQQFTATGYYNNGTNTNLTNSVIWSSTVTNVATINSAGLATAVSVGTTTITATSGTISGSAVLSTTPPSLVSVAVTPINTTIAPAATEQFTATGTYTDGSTQNLTSSASWSSTNVAFATISPTGLATGVAFGSTTISATMSGIVGTAKLTVGNPPTLVSIAVTATSLSVPLDTSDLLTATATYSDGSTQNLTGSAVTWSVGGIAGGNSTLGTISSLGLYLAPVTLPNPAQVTITATSTASSTVSGSAMLTVVQVNVTVTPTTAQVPGGATQQFVAAVSGPSNTAVTWSAGGVVGGNSTVGTINSTGVYTAPTTVPNPAQITVTATSVADGITSASATVTVTPPVSVTVTPTTTQTVPINQTFQFTATVTGSTNTAVTWSISGLVGGNTIIGTINSSGLYTAPPIVPYPGLQTITATSVVDPTKSASVGLRVIPPTPGVSITISPVSLWVQPGETWPFYLGIVGTSNLGVTWTVNGVLGGNSTLGTISTKGVYTAPSTVPSPAQVTVTATSASDTTKSASGTVTIATTPFSATPLVDFVPGQLYLGQFSGNLYNGSNSPPPDHDAVGLTMAGEVQPLDARGNPSPNGQIVLTSLGMSETQDDWCFGMTYCTSSSFMGQAAASNAVNHTSLVIVDGATSGASSATWICAEGNCPSDSSYTNKFDYVRDSVLTPAGVTEQQVQVVWIQEADLNPTYSPTLPSSSADAYNFEYLMGQTVRALKVRWPNVKQVFFSSRLYAGYTTTDQSPEPYAYEYGFAVKWLINAQIVQRETGFVDPIAGDLITAAPWIAWGPYLWGNGDNNPPGSLAITWVPSDFVTSDEMHPSAVGVGKVATALMNFFLDSTYTPWFR